MKKLIEQLLAHPSSKKIVAVIVAFLLSSLVIEMLFTHFVLKTIYIAFQQFQVMFKQDAQDEKRDYAEMEAFINQTEKDFAEAEKEDNEADHVMQQRFYCPIYLTLQEKEQAMAASENTHQALDLTFKAIRKEDIKRDRKMINTAIASNAFNPAECKKEDS